MLGKLTKFLIVTGVLLFAFSGTLFSLELFTESRYVPAMLVLSLSTILSGIGVLIMNHVDFDM